MMLSFVIPVRSDAAGLRRCLAAIAASVEGLPTEVIVIDNGSTDDSADVARRAGARVLTIPGRRVADLRNAAAAVASGDLLAFVDADQEIDPGWTAAAFDVMRNPNVVATGAQYHAPPNGTWVQRIYDLLRRHEPGDRPTTWLPSGNLVIRRDVFLEMGGFDATLETCEDVDLCQRLIQNGGHLLATDRLRSVHSGDPRTLKALFFGELWRGRDNLRVTLRVPITLRSLPSLALPLVTLSAVANMAVGLVSWPMGGWRIALAACGMLAAVSAARAAMMLVHARPHRPNATLALQAWLVSSVYDVARGLALVTRGGHNLRRKA